MVEGLLQIFGLLHSVDYESVMRTLGIIIEIQLNINEGKSIFDSETMKRIRVPRTKLLKPEGVESPVNVPTTFLTVILHCKSGLTQFEI
jgi:hypothetical protein